MNDAKPASGDGLPELPEPLKQVRVYADHGPASREPEDEVFDADQMRAIRDAGIAYGRRLATPEQPGSSVQGEADEAAMEAWHSAIEEAGELYVNAPDSRYANRARRVKAWIVSHRPTPPPAPVDANGLRDAAQALLREVQHADALGELPDQVQGETMFRLAQALSTPPAPAAEQPEGEWKLVPREPTQEMRAAGREAHYEAETRANEQWDAGKAGMSWRENRAAHVYAAMLAAAPAAPGVRVDEAMAERLRIAFYPLLENIKRCHIKDALTAALAPDGGERKGG